jgi:hypothetical protein
MNYNFSHMNLSKALIFKMAGFQLCFREVRFQIYKSFSSLEHYSLTNLQT